MSLVRSTLLVSMAAGASRILGFVRDVLIASALGAGPAADAFLVAYRIPNLVRRILTEGGMNAAFVPLYLRMRAEEGGDAAGRFASQSLVAVAVGVLGLVALVEIAAVPVVLALAAGYGDDPGTLGLTAAATRLAFPFVAFATLAAQIAALLNAERRFLAASLAPLAVNLSMIAALVWLSRSSLPPQQGALWLAAMVSVSGLVHLVIVGAAVRQLSVPFAGLRLRPSAPVRRLARVAGPALLASGAAQFIVLAGAEAASFEPSAVSWFYYAERVFQLPLGFIAAAAGLILLPELSHAARDDRALCEAQNRALEAGSLVALPAAVALVVLARPIVTVLFERGAFGGEDARQTAGLLIGLGLALPFAAAGKILSQAFFAHGDLRSVLVVSLIATFGTFAAALMATVGWGATGIGLGVAFGFALHAILLGGLSVRRGWWRPDRRCLSRVARSSIASALMGALLIAMSSAAGTWVQDGGRGLAAAVALVALCLAGGALYAGTSYALGAWTTEDFARARRR